MGWSWSEYEDTPDWVVGVLLAQLQRDHEEREHKAAVDEMRRRHGAGRH